MFSNMSIKAVDNFFNFHKSDENSMSHFDKMINED